jgi:hypothetical protein
LLDLRLALQRIGITEGIQLIDGSFVEDVEVTRLRPPADIDVVTIAARPVSDRISWAQMITANQDVFDSDAAKGRFRCDHYFLDTQKRPDLLVADAIYFSNLFSHQRTTSLSDVARGSIGFVLGQRKSIFQAHRRGWCHVFIGRAYSVDRIYYAIERRFQLGVD